ncbi:MAG: hypothetical protein HYU28_06170 [Actinobacteria bacterium]|nr:hypothetical protein [Actinomycetota bacterium]
MQDRPTASELLEAVSEFLERDVMTQEGRVGFHGRVARNVVDIVRRELELGPAADEVEMEGLRSLLGVDCPADLREANVALARLIREGALDERRADLLDHLRATAIAKLEIANPRELRDPGDE